MNNQSGTTTSTIRGEGAGKQSNKLNLGHTSTTVAAPQQQQQQAAPQPRAAPVQVQTQVQDVVVEKKVYVDVDSVEEKNIIAEAFAKMALLIMENKRLRSRLLKRKQELVRA